MRTPSAIYFDLVADAINYHEKLPRWAIYQEHRRCQALINSAKINPNHHVLDVGCGDGLLLHYLCGKGLRPLGIDISGVRIRHTALFLKRQSEVGVVAHGDIMDAGSLPQATFDIIFCSEVLEHLGEPAQALKHLVSLLKSDGILIISVPYEEIIHEEVCIHCEKLTPFSGHLHSFSLEKLEGLLDMAGLKAVQSKKLMTRFSAGARLVAAWSRVPYGLWQAWDRLTTIFSKPRWLIVLAKHEHA